MKLKIITAITKYTIAPLLLSKGLYQTSNIFLSFVVRGMTSFLLINNFCESILYEYVHCNTIGNITSSMESD